MLNVGLTGGIASGKTTIARMLMELGALHIDFDVLAHEAQKPDLPAWQAIVDGFGKGILNDDRTINREKLGAIVFQDRTKLRRLNEIVHPAVWEAWRRRVGAIVRKNPQAIILADVPLLIEEGKQFLFDLVLLVYVSPEEQIRRLVDRNGYSQEEAAARLASQMPIQEKMPLAGMVFNNEGAMDDLRPLLDDLWQELLKRERHKRETKELS